MIKDHWDDHAKQWSYIGAPLRPCAEDIQLIESYMHDNFALNRSVDSRVGKDFSIG